MYFMLFCILKTLVLLKMYQLYLPTYECLNVCFIQLLYIRVILYHVFWAGGLYVQINDFS